MPKFNSTPRQLRSCTVKIIPVTAVIFTLFGAMLCMAQEPPGKPLRVATNLSERDAEFIAIRTFENSLEALGNITVDVITYEKSSHEERAQDALRDLHSLAVDIAIVDIPLIDPSPFFSYSLVPFLAKDTKTAREYDLRLRSSLNRRLADQSLSALGTLPRLPRIIVTPQPAWDGALADATVLTTTRFEAERFDRLSGNGLEVPVEEMTQMFTPRTFGVVPMQTGIELARRAPALYAYDIRPSLPTMAILTGTRQAELPSELFELIKAVATEVEATAWHRIDQFADEVLQQQGLKMGKLERDFAARYSDLVLRSMDQNAQQPISEDVQIQTIELQRRISVSQQQTYAKFCRNMQILLVTNRALKRSTPFTSGMLLQKRGGEFLSEVSPKNYYGIIDLQVSANDTDLKFAKDQVGPCTDASGNITADKGFRLHRVRLYSRADFERRHKQVARPFSRGAQFLLFVHGFNVNFFDAVRTTADLSLRMEHKFIPVLVSWPSAGAIWAYKGDGARAAKSDGVIKETLAVLRSIAPAKSVQFIAHSMGNRIALNALLPDNARSTRSSAIASIAELVTVAPDVSCSRYIEVMTKITKAQSAGKRLIGRASLYLYDKDFALSISKWVHLLGEERCRMGSQRGAVAAQIDGIEAIDWSCTQDAVDSHSYYVQSNFIAGDLWSIIADHKPPLDRKLNRVLAGNGGFFLHSGIADPKKCLE